MNCTFVFSCLLVWFISAVVVECGAHVSKRAVHRIIIKGRRPRSGHKHHHYKHHNYYDESGESYERGKRTRGGKHGKRPSSYRGSREGDSEQKDSSVHYSSFDNSYEERPRHKTHKKRPPFDSDRSKAGAFPRGPSGWVPLVSAESGAPPPPKPHRPRRPALDIELTTRFPPKAAFAPFHDAGGSFQTLYRNFDKPAAAAPEGYAVHENHKDDGYLSPFRLAAHDVGPLLLGEASAVDAAVVEAGNFTAFTTTAAPKRGRGRHNRIKSGKGT